MSVIRFLPIAAVLVFSASCASIHEGNFAEPEKKGASSNVSSLGIVISGQENEDLSSKYIGEIDFTFENQSADWIHIKKVSLDFGNPEANQATQIPVGADLIAWAKAAEQTKAIRDYNDSLVLGSVALIGSAALATGGHNPSIRPLGAASALGAIGGLSVKAFQDERKKIEAAQLIPPSHLLADDFVIPPGLHTKKWIALYTKNTRPYLSSVTISYTLENGNTEKAVLKFRTPDSMSPWQGH